MQLGQYEALLGALAEELRRYLISRGADAEVAADIVQDMFVKVLESEIILPPDKLRPYLYRVAWSTYLDQYRRQRRYQQIIQEILGPALPTATHQPVAAYPELSRALRHLHAQERQLLVTRYVEQRSMKAIAGELGTSPAAVKMRLQRIQHKLEKRLRGRF